MRGGWQIVTSNKFSGIIYKAVPVPEPVLKLLTGFKIATSSAFPFVDNKGQLVRDLHVSNIVCGLYTKKRHSSVHFSEPIQFSSTQIIQINKYLLSVSLYMD